MLSNKVSEIVTTNLTTAQVTTSIFDVMQLMVSQNVGRVIITDQEVPVGIFTEKDVLRRVVITKVDAKQTAIKEVMTAPIRGVRVNDMGFFAHPSDRGRHDLFDRRLFGVDLCDYDSS